MSPSPSASAPTARLGAPATFDEPPAPPSGSAWTSPIAARWARAGGWFARAERELDDGGLDAVERGYLLLPTALQQIDQGEADAALDTYGQVAEIGARFNDLDLVTLGRVGRGEALIARTETRRGMAQLDEAMVAVVANDVSPTIAGIVYCSVIEACRKAFDLRRAQEWTAALTEWCERQPDIVPYRGRCLLHRAQLMQLRGQWADAEREAGLARKRMTLRHKDPAVGDAIYQQAELHRLRGAFVEAEAAYREASEFGRSPEPGLAQLRLAQGEVHGAAAMIRRALGEAHDQPTRARLLEPFVEIELAVGGVEAARDAAAELGRIATAFDSPQLSAMAQRADGAVRLSESSPAEALLHLRRSLSTWMELNAPFDAARVRVLLARACLDLGDADSAALELDAARRTFGALGAGPDLTRADALVGGTPGSPAGRRPDRLTWRELEVLRLVASGKTNRAIASELVLSEKTVARHLSNIFTKLGISSRASATAYAYEHDLVNAPGSRVTDARTRSSPDRRGDP